MPITTGALALGSTIIGGGGGGDTSDIEDLINDYAKGRIICNTSTMQVGDTVRVRSVTTNEYTDKTVTIVGGYLVFNVLCKDYYKICMLQGGGHQITITGYDSESYVDIEIFDGMIGTGLRVYSSITSGAPNDYNGTGINLYFDSNSNKWVLKSTGTIVYQNQQYTSGQTILEWSGQANILLEEIPTEIGGEYVEIGFGDVHISNVLDKTTLGGIQGILNAHQETVLLNIGDEVITTVNGSPYIVQIAKIDGSSHYVEFVSKNPSDDVVAINNANYKNRTAVLNWLSDFYSSIIEKDRSLIKDKVVNYISAGGSADSVTQKVWIPTRMETMGTGTEIGSQFPLFATQANRIRYDSSGIPHTYMLAGCTQTATAGYTDYITAQGTLNYTATAIYLLPCFRLTADS